MSDPTNTSSTPFRVGDTNSTASVTLTDGDRYRLNSLLSGGGRRMYRWNTPDYCDMMDLASRHFVNRIPTVDIYYDVFEITDQARMLMQPPPPSVPSLADRILTALEQEHTRLDVLFGQTYDYGVFGERVGVKRCMDIVRALVAADASAGEGMGGEHE